MKFGELVKYIMVGPVSVPADAPSDQPNSIYQAQLHPTEGILAQPYIAPVLPYRRADTVIPVTYDLKHPRNWGIHGDRPYLGGAPNVQQIDAIPVPIPQPADPSLPDNPGSYWQNLRNNLSSLSTPALPMLPGDEI